MSYRKPVIGPKLYVIVDPSGWPATFKRERADASLKKLIGDVPVATMAEGLLTHCRGLDEPVDWASTMQYLSTMTGFPQDAIAIEAAVAMWCQAKIALEKPVM